MGWSGSTAARDLLGLTLQIGLGLRSWQNYSRWPTLDAQADTRQDRGTGAQEAKAPTSIAASRRNDPAREAVAAGWPSVSVIVPARDEAANLMRLLPSLLCLEPAPLECLVVDDRSTDGTRAVATGFGARVVESTESPPGWSGKNWACLTGSRVAQGEWLLFTDADTWHAPASLGAAVATAMADRADLLSLFTGHECGSLWERLLLPFAYSHYFSAASAAWANDDQAPTALANGQYLLIRRTAYERIGGHAAVSSSLGEDVELARVLRRAGARVRVYRGEQLVKVRMYRSLEGIQTGFRKLMTGYLRAHPAHGVLIVASTVAAGLPVFVLLPMPGRRWRRLLALTAYFVGVAAYLPWLRWFGVSPWLGLAQPLAYVAFQAIALDAGLRSLLGVPVRWKGRLYPT